MAVWDLTGDGQFTRRDFNQSTAVSVDLNGDGKFVFCKFFDAEQAKAMSKSFP